MKARATASAATAAESHDLVSAVPYLVARAGARMGSAFAKRLKSYGLNLNEWRVCAALLRTPRQTLSDLSAYLSTDLSTLSRLVDRLDTAGLVARERSDLDGRVIRLSLSSGGVALTRRIVPLAKHFETVALTDFTPGETALLRELLRRLYDNAAPLELPDRQ